MEPAELRRLNFRRDGLSHEVCLDRLLALMDYAGLRRAQAAERARGRYLGIGLSAFVEQNAPGPVAYGAAGVKISAQEGCTLRLEPSGTVTCIVSCQDQGQGVETALAQLVAEELDLPLAAVRIVGYDTALPQKAGLYRLATACAYRACIEHGWRLNFSAGAAGFKRLRGGIPSIEYSAVHARHLPRRTRMAVASLSAGTCRIGVPLLRRYRL